MSDHYKIGDYVRGHWIVRWGYLVERQRALIREPYEFYGQIVGASNRRTGHVVGSKEDGREFVVDATKLVYLVRQGMLNLPLEVLQDDLLDASEDEIPWRWYNRSNLTSNNM